MTELELELLSILDTVGDNGRFCIQMGAVLPEARQIAFDHGLDEDLWILIDVGAVEGKGDHNYRIFRLTDRGWRRREMLRGGGPH